MMSMLHVIQNMKSKKKHGGHCGKSADVLEGIGRLKFKILELHFCLLLVVSNS